MNQVRLDLLRLVLIADVLGLLDEIPDFDESSPDENVAPLQPTRPLQNSYFQVQFDVQDLLTK